MLDKTRRVTIELDEYTYRHYTKAATQKNSTPAQEMEHWLYLGAFVHHEYKPGEDLDAIALAELETDGDS